jgi:hypothetical protein
MQRLIMPSFLVAALTVAALAQSGAAREPTLDDLVKLVPDDPALVVVIPDFSDVVAGIQAFGVAADVGDLAQFDADALFDEFDIRGLPDKWQGYLRKTGPFIFALTDAQSEPLLLCTVTEALEAPPSELIELKGDILIVAPDAEVMRAVKNAGGTFTKCFASRVQPALVEHDLAIFCDVPSWSVQIEPMLALGKMFVQMGAAATTQPTQVSLTMVNWVFQTLRTLVDEARTLVVAGRIGADGVHFSKTVHFDPAGKVAGYLGKISKPEKDPLRGLPPTPGTMVMAAEWVTPADVETVTEKMLDVLLSATTQPADQAEQPKLTPKLRRLYRILNGYNGVLAFGTQSEGMRARGLYFTDQGQAYLDGFEEMWKVTTPLMSSMAPGFTMELSEETEMVGSVKALVYRFKFDAPDEETRRLLRMMYGESIAVYAALHPEGVAYAMGPPEVARADLEGIMSAKSVSLSADRRVADALKKLSPRPQALVLLDLPGLMTWAAELAELSEEEMPQFKPPEKPLPYIGLSLYLHESAISAELFFPAKVVKYIVEQSETPTAPAPAEPY